MLQPNGIRFQCHDHDQLDRKTFGSHGTLQGYVKIIHLW
jgi:hypothetical protein